MILLKSWQADRSSDSTAESIVRRPDKIFNSALMEVGSVVEELIRHTEARYIKPIKSSEILLRGCLKDDEEHADSKPSSCAGANLLAKRPTLSTESYSKSLADTGKDPGIPQDKILLKLLAN
ncbi:predicted protein [Histoplasma capsulatum var. duboisii H88]|uniref:Predicted protein n=2 Tax=Ajellomyces capsulatus TaxID=5037 RepID=F0UET2_AJEC8|nr:predicted protein [Histoplasma capsulatum H143]EGC44812.1 predicted protein [Histoplasma capsulatum var. duboisii H88]